jgi:hypothetical protein
MIVEFFGHRAAGKSTLAAAVADELRRRGVVVELHNFQPTGEPESITRWQMVRTLATRPAFALLLFRGDVNRTELSRLILRDRRAHRLRARPGIHLVEESVTHLLPHYTRSWEGELVRSVLPRLHPPDLAVRVVCEPAEATARALRRGRDAVDRSPELIRRRIDLVAPNLRIVDRFAETIEVDTTAAGNHVGPLADELVRRLRPDGEGRQRTGRGGG